MPGKRSTTKRKTTRRAPPVYGEGRVKDAAMLAARLLVHAGIAALGHRATSNYQIGRINAGALINRDSGAFAPINVYDGRF